jgi:non-ribosomal peptide synthetase component F
MVEHRSIVNRILYMRRFLSFGPGDRTLFKTSPSFDVSLVEVFLPLLSGGAVVIPSDTEASDSAAVSEWVRKHGVTYIHFVPAMLRTYLDEGFRPGVDDGLRAVWCGGDVLSEALMRRFLSVSPARLINGYGPTEASVGVSAWECRYDHPYGQPPIGRPVDNTPIRIVDHLGRSLPPGMAGEIWVGGVQVARGYGN